MIHSLADADLNDANDAELEGLPDPGVLSLAA
jgi:hypothetical protein